MERDSDAHLNERLSETFYRELHSDNISSPWQKSRGPRAGVFGLQTRSEERAPRFETEAAGAVFSSRPTRDKACGPNPPAPRGLRRNGAVFVVADSCQ